MQCGVAATTQRNTAMQEAMIESVVQRLYMVGQIHGALDDLKRLDDRITRDLVGLQQGEASLLHAGGYIDKGNQVPELLDYLAARPALGVASMIYLLGAHECLMLRAIEGDQRAALEWLLSGAEASLDRWGVSIKNWQANLEKVILRSHVDFLRALPIYASDGRTRFFCETFANGPARPFGLASETASLDALEERPFCLSIGNFSRFMHGGAPDHWLLREMFAAGGIRCAVFERRTF
jgi:hypothetical protein